MMPKLILPRSSAVRRALAVLAAAVLGSSAPAARAGNTIIYVNAAAAPGGNGTSWATAFQNLSDALNAAGTISPQPSQVWVAEGVYTPAAGGTFFIPLGAEVYGGFFGSETSLSQRDPVANLTIISGDSSNNSTPTGQGIADDSFIVVAMNQTDARPTTQILDGFTVEYARTTLLDVSNGAKPRIENCTFRYVFGGGQAAVSGVRINVNSPTVFTGNTIHTIVGFNPTANGIDGADGNTGPAGANGGNGGTPSNGGVGGQGLNGQPGGNGANGGGAIGVHLFGASNSAIVGNRIFNIFGGDGTNGGNGGDGGDGGTGGNGGSHTAGGPGASAGNGGRGGNGGTAGSGGNGGPVWGILCDVASVAPAAIANNLIYNLLPGDGGLPGNPGAGGRGGNGGNGGSGSTGGPGGNGGTGGTGGLGGQGGGAGPANAITISSATAAITLHHNTADVSRTATPGPAGGGGVGGAPGSGGTGGTGSPPGNNGSTGGPGAPGPSGDNGTTPKSVAIAAVGGSAPINVFNSAFRLTSGGSVNAFLAETSGSVITVDHSISTTVANSGTVTLGARTLSADPNFFNITGQDGIPGTEDDDYSLRTPSLAIDAGSNSLIAPDAADLDRDGDTNEPTPIDILGRPRRADVPGVFDQGTPPVIDMGAFEADPTPPTVVLFEPESTSYAASPAEFILLFDRPVSGVPFGLVSVRTTGDVNVNNLSIERINDQFFIITAGFTPNSSGTLNAVVSDVDTILSQVGVPLNGPGTGSVVSAPTTILGGGVGPSVEDFFLSTQSPVLPNSTVTFGLDFSETVSGVSSGAFSINATNLTNAFVSNIFSQDGRNYTIEVNSGQPTAGDSGTFTLTFTNNGTISSIASGLPLEFPAQGVSIDAPTVTVQSGTFTDCNNNGIPDSTDISSGTSQDCNNNNVPDECDIAGSLPNQSFGPLPYLSEADSPFPLTGLGTSAFLETFEDNQFNVPGVSASAGAPFGPTFLADSVDADDGVIDGLGRDGRSFFSGNGAGGITFTFNSSAFGRLPQYAGVVWTDGNGIVTFEAFDQSGASLGSFPSHTADSSNEGVTANHRFYGVVNHAGISAIRVSNSGGGIEVDHLQYGVFTGTSQDANGNGIPDECEVGSLDANYSIDNSWRMNPFEPPPGWNTQLNFDDSDSAGWGLPVFIQPLDPPLLGGYWSFPGTSGGSNQTFLRKKVRLLAAPQPGEALLTVVADDDVQVFINGNLVVDDQDGLGGPVNIVNAAPFLVAGENLIAVVATDAICCGRFVGVALQLPGSITDCNNNAVPDRSEIASGAVPDVNGNGVPDECEGVTQPLRPYPFDQQTAVSPPGFTIDLTDIRGRAADLNADGLIDLITAGGVDPKVLLRGGPGELMYFSPTLPSVGSQLFDAVAADFNNDGRTDLVFSRAGADPIVALRNVANSPLSYVVTTSGGADASNIARLAVIDAGSDGRKDLLALGVNGQFRLFRNTGAGSAIQFTPENIPIPALTRGDGGIDILVRDLDSNGFDDIVVLFGGYVTLLGGPNGFIPGGSSDNAPAYSALALADLDRFGGVDLFRSRIDGTSEVVDPITSQVEFTMNSGGFQSLFPGDIDQNAREDLAAVRADGGLSWITIQDDPFVLAERRVTTPPGFVSALLADIDPDGDLDLIALEALTTGFGNDEGGADDNPRSGSPARFRIIPSRVPHRNLDMFGITQVAGAADAPTAAAAADIDGDGTLDLVTASFFDDAVSWRRPVLFDSQGWQRTVVASTGTNPKVDGPSAVAVADLDKDGATDIIAAGILNNTVVWYENNGDGSGWTPRSVDAGATGVSCLATSDVNSDGRTDIVAGLSNGTIRVYYNNVGLPHGLPAFSTDNILTSGGAVRAVVATDLDRDGLVDLVAADNAGFIRVLSQSSPGVRGSTLPEFTPLAPMPSPSPTALLVRDFNGDGLPDIAHSSSSDATVTLRLQTSPRLFGAPSVVASGLAGASALAAGDFDLDGDADLAVAGRQITDIIRLTNNGNGTFQLFNCFTSIEGASAIIAADFDSDGLDDLLAASFVNDKFLWIKNNSSAFYAFAVGEASAVSEGSRAAVARVDATQFGRPGDLSFAYSRFIAFFQSRGSVPGQPSPVPLTEPQINALISRIEVFADTNDNSLWDTGDASIGFRQGPFNFETFDLSNVVSFPLNTASADNRIPPDGREEFFVVVTTQSAASSASPNTFAMLVNVSGSTFVDTRFGEPVEPRFGGFYAGNTVSVGPDFRPFCPTDINQNGVTDTPDLVAFLGSYGESIQPYTRGDVNGDGRVTTSDLVRILANFGTDCR